MGIETILLAVSTEDNDRVERIAEETIKVAKPCGSEVVLTHVFSQSAFESSRDRLGIDPSSEEATPDGVAVRHSATRKLADLFEEADIPYRIRGEVGEEGPTIAAIAAEVDADRVIVSGRKRSPTGKAVFGSVAQDVMLDSPCPVTFVREDA